MKSDAVDWTDCALVEVNPRKASGVPILKATRVQADSIVENFKSGSSIKEIAENFSIPKAMIRDVLTYAEQEPERQRKRIYFAAYQYLGEWIGSDRRAMRALSDESHADFGEAVEELTRIATVYGVARGFRKSAGERRFENVWNVLKDARRPTDADEVSDLVDDVIERFKEEHEHALLSATTKFLWMRFQRPVVIYDSLTWKWIFKHRDDGPTKTYKDFYRVWQKRFIHYQPTISEACRDLPITIQFQRPNQIPSDEMEQALASDWFAERVFDTFMVYSDSLATTDAE